MISNIVIKEAENLNQGEVLLVRGLFKGYEWSSLLFACILL
jgi:hypothetical protein